MKISLLLLAAGIVGATIITVSFFDHLHVHRNETRDKSRKFPATDVAMYCKCPNLKIVARFPKDNIVTTFPLAKILKMQYNCTNCVYGFINYRSAFKSPSRASGASFYIIRTGSQHAKKILIHKAEGIRSEKSFYYAQYRCSCGDTVKEARYSLISDTDIDMLEVMVNDRFEEKGFNCSLWTVNCKLSIDHHLKCLKKTHRFEYVQQKENSDSKLDPETHIIEDVQQKKWNDSKPEPGSRRKYRLASRGCNFPQGMKTAHVSCTEYPKKIKCIQRCIFGYTLDEGISREISCKYSENIWRPLGFQECSPFVDCSLDLVAIGYKSCRLGTPYIPSGCNVTCGRYEDKEPTNLTWYECQVSGGWDKELPHCVIPSSGLDVVPAPKIKVHDLAMESEEKQKIKLEKKMHNHIQGRKLGF